MPQHFYLDTSIWLDFFEDRDEPNFPKSEWTHQLLNKITKNNDKVIYSDAVLFELNVAGYNSYEISNIFKPIRQILIFVEANEKQIGKAKDLALKRDIPKRDALHAIIARDNKAVLVTLDRHFQKLTDIIQPKRPQEII